MNDLSVIVVARHVSERLLALLRVVRPVASELVVAVDDRAGDDGLGAAEHVADVVVTFPFLDVIERSWAWIAGLARGPWVLWLDDDVVPSPALLEALPRLVAADDVTHYHLRHRWLWPDAGNALTSEPWQPDFHPRLFRSDAATVWFPGVVHVPIKVIGPTRYVDEALLHLDLAVNGLSSRRSKAAAYEQRRPGLRAAGRPLSEAFYVPEDRPGRPPTVALSAVDSEAVAAIVSLPDTPLAGAPAARAIRRGTRAEVDAVFHGWLSEPEDDVAVIEVMGDVGPLIAGVRSLVEVRVTNQSQRTWPPPGLGVPDVRLSYRWRADDGSAVVGAGLHTALPVGMPPAASELVVAHVDPPTTPGSYTLAFDLLREHVRWFGCESSVVVEVRSRASVAVLVDETDPLLATEVAGLLVDRLPSVSPVLLGRDGDATGTRTGYEARDDPSASLFARGAAAALADVGTVLMRPARVVERTEDLLIVAGTGDRSRRAQLRRAGLQRAFARSGAPSVVVEREAVPSRRSARLLAPPHECLAADDLDGVERAVRAALRLPPAAARLG